MKNNQERLSRMKFKLAEAKKAKKPVVEWKLSPEQQNYIRNLGYRIEPCLYEVKTKRFENIHSIKMPLIRDIHYASQKKKCTVTKKLNHNGQKILEEYRIQYWPIKFKIYLS